MMMKALMFHQQQQPQVEENMSNLTSASGEAASISSGNRNNNELTATNYPQLHHHHHQQPQQQQQQQFFAHPPPPQSQPLAKKKRNLPGNPDPDAEVIALSPKTLMATNRFMCEICNKGFQRDQNLQLHRRGHNLPWKLKQRTSKEIRKKVYVCPEASCVHHDPARALGDLTGVKKHFSRKHGEKKWKCEKCSKRYAVQSDCKAHYKTCGTREYRCDCGTLFSRRDSFITHRAFCDALAEESARDRILLPSQPPPTGPSSTPPPPPPPHVNLQIPQLDLHAFSLKKEQRYYNSSATLRPELPSWLGAGPGSGPPIYHDHVHDQFTQTHHQDLSSNPNPSLGPTLLSSHHYHHPSAAPIASPHMSATALLQKAAQMGATSSSSSSKTSTSSWPHLQDHHQAHVSVDSSAANNANTIASSTPHFGLNLPSREGLVIHGLGPHRRPGSGAAGTTVSDHAPLPPPPPLPINSFLQDMVMMNSLSSGFVEGTSFEDSFVGVGVLNSKKDGNFHDTLLKTTTNNNHGGNAGNEGLTRDFLGLRPLSHHSHILNMAGIGDCVNTSAHHEQHFQSPKPWQG